MQTGRGCEGSEEDIKHEDNRHGRPELVATAKCSPHFSHHWHDGFALNVVNCEICIWIAAGLLPVS
jgi:hypothetical protein